MYRQAREAEAERPEEIYQHRSQNPVPQTFRDVQSHHLQIYVIWPPIR